MHSLVGGFCLSLTAAPGQMILITMLKLEMLASVHWSLVAMKTNTNA